jgi:hypothetical protein
MQCEVEVMEEQEISVDLMEALRGLEELGLIEIRDIE